jgi:protein tyrosine phosphatase (PTP) superfamily phosphohydrolase (DUF442 family)
MRSSSLIRPLVLTSLFVLVTSCGSADTPEGTAEGSPATASSAAGEATVANAGAGADAFALASELDVRNARMPVPGLITAGQPTEEQFDALVEAGVTRFVSLRVAEERGAGWEEAHSAGADYDFDRLPISGADALTRENVEALAEILQEGGEGPTVLYCGSSNRVGALLALKAFWLDDVEAEAALEIGRAAGMTGMETAVREIMGSESSK